MVTAIETSCGKFQRTAWTGGDTPPLEFVKSSLGIQLIKFFYEDQIADCGGLSEIDNWLFGNTREEKLEIFRNRAVLDAWRTAQNPLTSAQ